MSSSRSKNKHPGICATIHANAMAAPDKIIVSDSHQQWSWAELMHHARAYAKSIKNTGLPPSAIIPIIVGRRCESIGAILGCLFAGHAFSPLSIDQPAARLSACLTRMNALFVLADTPTAGTERSTIAGLPVLQPEQVVAAPTSERAPEASDERHLYVLFTSGSTGQPKGVVVDHGNIINTLTWAEEILDWRDDDVIGVAVNLYFDIAMFDIFTSLTSNVPMAILSNAADIHLTCSEIGKFAVTSIFAAPVFFSQFVRASVIGKPELSHLRRIISGGDFFAPAHMLAWMDSRPDLAIYNVWGPTETSIVNTMHLVNPQDRAGLVRGQSPAVGRAHPLMPFVLLDEDLRQVDGPGLKGEICMQGPCVTVGYLEDRERTENAYIVLNGERTFRTGDLGSLDADGNLYIHGRIGSLIKVAGHRIDVGEVEGAAASADQVHAAAAFLHDVDVGIQELWLAIELKPRYTDIDLFAFKKLLRELLPVYMVPKKIVVMEALPTTPNLKIDRRALSEKFNDPV